MKIEFIKYIPTPTAKFLGIAEIMIEGKLVLRYKLAPGKDGKGIFIQPASYGIDSPNGVEYKRCFEWDSNLLKDDIESMIRKAFNAAQAKPGQSTSVFSKSENEESVPF